MLIPPDTAITHWPSFLQEQEKNSNHSVIKKFSASQIFVEGLTVDQANFVAMDFETTGLNADSDEIISVGLVPFNCQRIFLSQSQEWVVKPRRTLHEKSVTFHGITHSQVKGAPDLSDILSAVLTRLSAKVIVVHYKPIERYFFSNAVLHRWGEPVFFPVIDTMNLAAQMQSRGVMTKLRQAFSRYKQSVRLADCRQRYGLPRYRMHNATSDALATAELLQAILKHHFSSDTRVTDLLE